MAAPPIEEEPVTVVPSGIPLADAAPLEEYLSRICPLIFDLDDEGAAQLRAALAEPLAKSKLKAFATEARSPVLVVSKRQIDGMLMNFFFSI